MDEMHKDHHLSEALLIYVYFAKKKTLNACMICMRSIIFRTMLLCCNMYGFQALASGSSGCKYNGVFTEHLLSWQKYYV